MSSRAMLLVIGAAGLTALTITNRPLAGLAAAFGTWIALAIATS